MTDLGILFNLSPTMSASFDKDLLIWLNKNSHSQNNNKTATYLLPVGNLSGFRLPNFNAAKTNSTGADEYEYGPENITYG